MRILTALPIALVAVLAPVPLSAQRACFDAAVASQPAPPDYPNARHLRRWNVAFINNCPDPVRLTWMARQSGREDYWGDGLSEIVEPGQTIRGTGGWDTEISGTRIPTPLAMFCVNTPPEFEPCLTSRNWTGMNGTPVTGADALAAERTAARTAAYLATAAAPGGGMCEISGWPTDIGDPDLIGLNWCPVSVGMQVRSHALVAAGGWCAINHGTSSTPQQIAARHRQINDNCDILNQLVTRGISDGGCVCPQGYRPGR